MFGVREEAEAQMPSNLQSQTVPISSPARLHGFQRATVLYWWWLVVEAGRRATEASRGGACHPRQAQAVFSVKGDPAAKKQSTVNEPHRGQDMCGLTGSLNPEVTHRPHSRDLCSLPESAPVSF